MKRSRKRNFVAQEQWHITVSKDKAEQVAETLMFEIWAIEKYCLQHDECRGSELFANATRIRNIYDIMKEFSWTLDRDLIVERMTHDMEYAAGIGISYVDMICKRYQ